MSYTQQQLQRIRRIDNDMARLFALRNLAQRIPDVAQAQRIITTIPDDMERSYALRDLVQRQRTQPYGGGAAAQQHIDVIPLSERRPSDRRQLSAQMSGGSQAPRQPTEIGRLIARIRELEGDTADLQHRFPTIVDTISSQIMEDPVQIGTGHMYNSQSIKTWFKTNKRKTDPKTRQQAKDPIPNVTVRGIIIEILQDEIRRLERSKRQKQQKQPLQQKQEKQIPQQKERQQLIRRYHQQMNPSEEQLTRFRTLTKEKMKQIIGRLTRTGKK